MRRTRLLAWAGGILLLAGLAVLWLRDDQPARRAAPAEPDRTERPSDLITGTAASSDRPPVLRTNDDVEPVVLATQQVPSLERARSIRVRVAGRARRGSVKIEVFDDRGSSRHSGTLLPGQVQEIRGLPWQALHARASDRTSQVTQRASWDGITELVLLPRVRIEGKVDLKVRRTGGLWDWGPLEGAAVYAECNDSDGTMWGGELGCLDVSSVSDAKGAFVLDVENRPITVWARHPVWGLVGRYVGEPEETWVHLAFEVSPKSDPIRVVSTEGTPLTGSLEAGHVATGLRTVDFKGGSVQVPARPALDEWVVRCDGHQPAWLSNVLKKQGEGRVATLQRVSEVVVTVKDAAGKAISAAWARWVPDDDIQSWMPRVDAFFGGRLRLAFPPQPATLRVWAPRMQSRWLRWPLQESTVVLQADPGTVLELDDDVPDPEELHIDRPIEGGEFEWSLNVRGRKPIVWGLPDREFAARLIVGEERTSIPLRIRGGTRVRVRMP